MSDPEGRNELPPTFPTVAETSHHEAIVGAPPYTPMGIVESYGHVARATRSSNRSHRIMGFVMLFLLLVPIVLGMVALLFNHL